jgi:hypothetical protein
VVVADFVSGGLVKTPVNVIIPLTETETLEVPVPTGLQVEVVGGWVLMQHPSEVAVRQPHVSPATQHAKPHWVQDAVWVTVAVALAVVQAPFTQRSLPTQHWVGFWLGQRVPGVRPHVYFPVQGSKWGPSSVVVHTPVLVAVTGAVGTIVVVNVTVTSSVETRVMVRVAVMGAV